MADMNRKVKRDLQILSRGRVVSPKRVELMDFLNRLPFLLEEVSDPREIYQEEPDSDGTIAFVYSGTSDLTYKSNPVYLTLEVYIDSDDSGSVFAFLEIPSTSKDGSVSKRRGTETNTPVGHLDFTSLNDSSLVRDLEALIQEGYHSKVYDWYIS